MQGRLFWHSRRPASNLTWPKESLLMQSPLDRALMQATQTGLPLTPTPYADLANTRGVS